MISAFLNHFHPLFWPREELFYENFMVNRYQKWTTPSSEDGCLSRGWLEVWCSALVVFWLTYTYNWHTNPSSPLLLWWRLVIPRWRWSIDDWESCSVWCCTKVWSLDGVSWQRCELPSCCYCPLYSVLIAYCEITLVLDSCRINDSHFLTVVVVKNFYCCFWCM